MSSLKQIEIVVNEDPQLIAQLRRTGGLVTDEHGERVDAMYDGHSRSFYVGHPQVLPKDWAEGFLVNYVVPLQEPCPHCKGKGSTSAGICHECKGTKWHDLNKLVRVFKQVGSSEIPLFDPTKSPLPPPKKVTELTTRA